MDFQHVSSSDSPLCLDFGWRIHVGEKLNFLNHYIDTLKCNPVRGFGHR